MRSWWRNTLNGFWFVPGALALAYVVLALLLIQVDRAAGNERGVRYGFGGDASAARDVLSTIAGSLITVAGLAFSITIVVLTMVSSQFTPRALQSFLADRTNQVVAGTFVGIFAYSLVVLRAVRGDEVTDRFVPGLAVSVAILLGLVALAFLLVFIHHMGQSVQLAHIVARIGKQTLGAIETLYPERFGEEEESAVELVEQWRREGDPATVHPARPGYVQSIEADSIANRLARPGVRIRVAVRPGDFVTEADTLVEVWPAAALDADDADAVRPCVSVENEREVGQDAAFGLRQLTDIALRGLSPGVNDPSTALAALGYLRAALERLAERDVPAGERRIGDLTVVLESRSFEDFVSEPIAELGRYAAASARVATTLLDIVAVIADRARAAGAFGRLRVLSGLIDAVGEPALESAASEYERRAVEAAIDRARAATG